MRTVYIDTVDSSRFDVCQTMYPKNLAKGKSVTEDACIEEVRFQYSSNRIEILLHHKFAWEVPHNRDFPFVDYKMEVLAGVLCQMKAQGHKLQDDPKFSVFTHKDIWNDGSPIGTELSNMHKPEVHVLRIPLMWENQAMERPVETLQKFGMSISRTTMFLFTGID